MGWLRPPGRIDIRGIEVPVHHPELLGLQAAVGKRSETQGKIKPLVNQTDPLITEIKRQGYFGKAADKHPNMINPRAEGQNCWHGNG